MSTTPIYIEKIVELVVPTSKQIYQFPMARAHAIRYMSFVNEILGCWGDDSKESAENTLGHKAGDVGVSRVKLFQIFVTGIIDLFRIKVHVDKANEYKALYNDLFYPVEELCRLAMNLKHRPNSFTPHYPYRDHKLLAAAFLFCGFDLKVFTDDDGSRKLCVCCVKEEADCVLRTLIPLSETNLLTIGAYIPRCLWKDLSL